MNEIWLACPIVEVVKPACPFCGHEAYIPNRTFQNGDGSTTRRCICERCSKPYIVAVEKLLPNFGGCIVWPS